MEFENTIRCIDNLELLKQLPSESIDLIYCDILYNTGKKFKDYDDRLKTPQEAIEWYRPRLIEMKRALKDTGSIYLQCDDNISHYLKVEMDKLFGVKNFRNEIVWIRTVGGKTTSCKFPNDLDKILFYTKNNKYTFNKTFKPLPDVTKNTYKYDDGDGRGLYASTPLNKPSNPTIGTVYDYTDNNGNVWKCPKYGWSMTEDNLRKMENDNRIIYGKSTLRRKSYWNERLDSGKLCNNLWDDIKNTTNSSTESVGYDTQKPKALLERIIKASSNEGDIVADFFMGSGTTCVVAKELGRKYIGCDINPRAIEIAEKRIAETLANKGVAYTH